jgi:integrase/recombinase XerD
MGKKAPKRPRARHNTYFVELKTRAKSRAAKKPRRAKRKAKTLPDYLTVAEKDALLAAIHAPRDRALFRLLLYHGLRASEIGLLQLADYHRGPSLDTDRLRIQRLKGSIGGDTTLVNAAAAALRIYVRIRGAEPGPLFLSRNHRAIGRAQIWLLMKRYCELAGVPPEKAHPHALKHTCCTLLLSDRRESIVDVQTHVGHADIRSTLVYAKLTDRANLERARRLRDWK